MNELQTEILDISDDALDALFNETPEKTVNANTLIGGQKETEDIEDVEDEEEVEEKPKKASKKEKSKTTPQQQSNEIEDINLDEFPEKTEGEEEEEEEKKPTKETKESKAKKEAEEAIAKAKEEEEQGGEEVTSVLKSTVDYLIQQGIWEDFEGREDMEITEETYAKLVAEQDKRRVEGMFSELVDSTGPFGKAIIDFVKSGGNPDEIIDLFKEQKQVESISIESVEGQKEIIKHYYTEVMGWKPEKAEKYISNLVLSNELEPEAQEVKDLFTSFYKKEADKLTAERQEFETKRKEAEQAFESNIKNTIKERKDLTPTEKKVVEEYLLAYDQRLPNGNMVNKFYVNFAKMQANPEDYIDLVMFVMDKQKFVQKVQTTEKTKAASEAFKFIKGNGAVSNKKGTSYENIKKNEKVSGFDWGFAPKK